MKQIKLTSADKALIEKSVRKKYSSVAKSSAGLFKYPTGKEGMKALLYDNEFIEALTDSAAASYCGVGNPFTLGHIGKDAAVLDIGCGSGIDTIVAARLVGSDGLALGIDITLGMLIKSKKNASDMDLKNAFFMESSAEKLPIADATFDTVISNGALNLVIDKLGAFKEIFRVLKPGGRVMVADETLTGSQPDKVEDVIKSWFR